MDKEMYEEFVALAKRVDELERPVTAVICTAPYAVTYTVDGVSKRYEGPTIFDLMTLIEKDQKNER
jgi:hypothetical protein